MATEQSVPPATSEFKTYYGNCHCGSYKFNVKIPELGTVAAQGPSICPEEGYLWIVPSHGPLEIEVERDGELKSYEYAGNTLVHKFCPKCGTTVLAESNSAPDGQRIAINARSLRGYDFWELEAKSNTFATLPPAYRIPQVSRHDTVPQHDLVPGEGEKIYSGACHCGAVQLVVKTKPLPEVEVKRCDCSICSRFGYLLFYPSVRHARVFGGDNLTGYRMGRKFGEHEFCSTCGVPLYIKIIGPPESVTKDWVGAKREMLEKNLDLMPINVRVLNGVEWEGVKVTEEKEGQDGYVVD